MQLRPRFFKRSVLPFTTPEIFTFTCFSKFNLCSPGVPSTKVSLPQGHPFSAPVCVFSSFFFFLFFAILQFHPHPSLCRTCCSYPMAFYKFHVILGLHSLTPLRRSISFSFWYSHSQLPRFFAPGAMHSLTSPILGCVSDMGLLRLLHFPECDNWP